MTTIRAVRSDRGSRRRGRPMAQWIGLIFLLIGLGLQIGAGVAAINARRWLATTVSTTGTVVDRVLRSQRRRSTTYAERVRFTTPDGTIVEFTSRMATSRPYAIGSTVPVRYLPGQPTTGDVEGFWRVWFVTIILGGMGLVFGGLGWNMRISGAARTNPRRSTSSADSAPLPEQDRQVR